MSYYFDSYLPPFHQLNCAKSSILEDQNAVEGLRNGTLTPKKLAAMSLSVTDDDVTDKSSHDDYIPKDEVWSILAVNKFESDRCVLCDKLRFSYMFKSQLIYIYIYCKIIFENRIKSISTYYFTKTLIIPKNNFTY